MKVFKVLYNDGQVTEFIRVTEKEEDLFTKPFPLKKDKVLQITDLTQKYIDYLHFDEINDAILHGELDGLYGEFTEVILGLFETLNADKQSQMTA